MPGFNRKGPEGIGPITGGGRGLCNNANRPFFNREGSFMAAAGRGRGSGNCRWLQGMGRRAGSGYAETVSYDKDQEKSILENEEAMLKDELEAIKQRLEKIKATT